MNAMGKKYYQKDKTLLPI